MKLISIVISSVLFAAAVNGQAMAGTCDDLEITTCTKGAEGSCDMICDEKDGFISPPCTTKCRGDGRGGVLNCQVWKGNNRRTRSLRVACNNDGLDVEEDFIEVVATSHPANPEANEAAVAKSIASFLRSIEE